MESDEKTGIGNSPLDCPSIFCMRFWTDSDLGDFFQFVETVVLSWRMYRSYFLVSVNLTNVYSTLIGVLFITWPCVVSLILSPSQSAVVPVKIGSFSRQDKVCFICNRTQREVAYYKGNEWSQRSPQLWWKMESFSPKLRGDHVMTLRVRGRDSILALPVSFS